MLRRIVIADYGLGNIRSIQNALKNVVGVDHEVVLGTNPEIIESADRIILPGVGAFAECKAKLLASGMLDSILNSVRKGRPLMGICVGMQILADKGLEHGETDGLSLIPGVVRQIQKDKNDKKIKLPHVGWNPIYPLKSDLFKGVETGSYYYFVHSYIFDCADKNHEAARSEYGEGFAAAVIRGNVFGCQFHPEKSAEMGLRLLKNFCQWAP